MKPKGFSALPSARLRFIEPMYARLLKRLPEGSEWQCEIKFYGYRCLAGRSQSGVNLWSRKNNSITDQFPEVAQACQSLEPDTLIDGEIVAFDKNGRISFNVLQNYRSRAQAIRYYVFDLILYRGKSLLKVPLRTRRGLLVAALEKLANNVDCIRLSEVFDSSPADLIPASAELGLEGIMAKRKDSVYESGKRTGAWVKYKLGKSQPFVIGGYTTGHPFDGLIVGYYDEGKLPFGGKVRSGFVPRIRAEIARRLRGLENDNCPLPTCRRKDARNGR